MVRRNPLIWAPLWLAVALSAPLPRPAGAESGAAPSVREWMAAMTPEQRVGQLALVSFAGAAVADDTVIADLIDRYGVGGVVLDPAAGNFVNRPDAPAQVARLTNELQARSLGSPAPDIPLLLAVAASGNGFPGSKLWGGLTPLPSAMAIGATWDPVHAERMGWLAGHELAAVGVNLLLGPRLDVLASPRPGSSADLGVRSFGGSPYWVGRLGRAFIQGVHRGGAGRVVTAAGSFPGSGGADRSPDQESAIVDRSLPDLLAGELAPFVAVAELGADPDGQTDAFLSSHVHYRSIQQQSAAPLSLDGGGLTTLWSHVPALNAWRAEGGVVVSAGLGLPVVRRYVDPEAGVLNGRRVIREALIAGNDLLVLTDFGPPGDSDAQAVNVRQGLDWLAQAYRDDEAVRTRVDAALERILTLKLRLYHSAIERAGSPPEAVRVDESGVASAVGQGRDDVVAVARDALTLLKPADVARGGGTLPSPQPGERILFVVDARAQRECAACPPYLSPDPEFFATFARRLYGPDAGGVALLQANEDVAAITFSELKAWLQATGRIELAAGSTPPQRLSAARQREVGGWLGEAEWVVFALQDLRLAEAPAADALRLFLQTSPSELGDRRQRLVALALDAPYGLDTTEIAKLSAYYAVFGQTEPFLETAIRAVFGDERALGASPVSVPGASYDLAQRLAPAPGQEVSLELVGDHPPAARLGDAVTVRTSVIRDANGHPVPDGTVLNFRRFQRNEGVFLADVPALTAAGRAVAELQVEREGQLEIAVVHYDQVLGQALALTVEGDGPSLPPLLIQNPLLDRPTVPADWGIFFLSLTLMVLAGVLVYGVDGEAGRSPARLLRLYLLGMAWGLAGYLLVVAGGLHLAAMPGGARLWPRHWNVVYQAPLVSFVFALIPILPSMVRSLRRDRAAGLARAE
jgi:beta-N-acetylhexosaminidase